jgi:GT2 family glycosyltransferase
MKCAILMPVHNKLEYTKSSIVSILQQLNDLPDKKRIFEIVIIDDGSTDGTSEYILNHHPNIHLLNGNGNLWWSGSINLGIKYSINELGADYFLFWNNDIKPHKSYFNNLFEILLKKKKNQIIGSKVMDLNNTEIVWSMGGYFDPKTGAYDMYLRNEKDAPQKYKLEFIDWLPGMGSLFHSSVLQKTGELDAVSFPQYHGDSDYTYRAKNNGFEIIVDPSLIIYNDTSNTGLKKDDTLKSLFRSMKSIKSNYNISKDILFYRKYATSLFAYRALFYKYFRFFGGFFKWRILNILGVKRNKN